MIAAPALNGFYLSLGPSLAAQVLRSPDLLWGGLVIFLVAGTGAAASIAFSTVDGPVAMLVGCLALLAGAVMTLAAIETASAAAFLAGTAVAGAGVGTGFFAGAYRILTALADGGQRAGLVAAIWVVFYLAFSVPVVAAGVATTHFGLHQTAVVYSGALAVLAAAAAGSFLFRSRSRPSSPSAPPEALRVSRPDLWKGPTSRASARGGMPRGGQCCPSSSHAQQRSAPGTPATHKVRSRNGYPSAPTAGHSGNVQAAAKNPALAWSRNPFRNRIRRCHVLLLSRKFHVVGGGGSVDDGGRRAGADRPLAGPAARH
jgi:MFS family permease